MDRQLNFNSMFEDVANFHREVLKMQDTTPHNLNPMEMIQRINFMFEELRELRTAYDKLSLVDQADALADLVYVAFGTAYQMGLPMEQIWDAVHAANMRKVAGKTKRNMAIDACKPDGWTGPEAEIEACIYAATARGACDAPVP